MAGAVHFNEENKQSWDRMKGRDSRIPHQARGGEGMSARAMKKRAAAAHQKRQRRQFVALARRLTPRDVKVTFHNGDFGYAKQRKREIYVPHLRTASDLRIYLHELGHILNRPPCNSEAEYQAERYSFKMMRRAGIHLPRWIRKQSIAYTGWFVVVDLLHDNPVSAAALAFVGLKGVHRIAILRAHLIATERIGYVPKREWIGKGKHKMMMAPVDTEYWSTLLASVPKARRRQPGFALIRIDLSKPLALDNVAWSRWPESAPQVYPLRTEAEHKEWMAEIKQQEAVRQPIIEAMKQELIDRDELDPMTEAMIDADMWDDDEVCHE
jgi:hypothetical protein